MCETMTERAGFDLQAVLDNVAETAARLFGSETATIFLVGGARYHRVAVWGRPGTASESEWWSLDRDAIPARVIRNRAPVHVDDVQQLPLTGEFGGSARG